MKKTITILLALLTVVAAVGCAEERSPYNSPDQQRSHAGKAQGDLPK
jgi:hypothetical protein